MKPVRLPGLLSAAAVMLLCCGAAAQEGEKIEADVSAREIAIESTFTGVRIVVFGAVENSRQRNPGYYDVAVVIRGPEEAVIARRKDRVAFIWLNTESRSFARVPGYYAVLTTRPLDELAPPQVLDKNSIGFDALRFMLDDATQDTKLRDSPFRNALVRIKQREGLFYANERGVEFLGSSLFRSTVFLPANVPVGQYTADIFLFHGGTLLSHTISHFTLHKQGFEKVVYVLAFDYPLAYGILAVLVAIAAGLAASAMFRRD